MKILFIRHAQREKKFRPFWQRKSKHQTATECSCQKCEDRRSKLTPYGERAAQDLGSHLELFENRRIYGFHSEYTHSQQTAELIIKDSSKVDTLMELNPGTNAQIVLGAVLKRAQQNKLPLDKESTIVLVGHEPLLNQVIAVATGKRVRPLKQLEVVCLSVTQHLDLLCGDATLDWRFPVRAYEEEALREKVGRKMTVATFLAGFTFTALMSVLLRKELNAVAVQGFPRELPSIETLLMLTGSLLLTASVGLFVAAVYAYDQLSMPEGFWGASRAGPWRRWTTFDDDQRNEYGELYTLMVDTWTFCFTPAVILAALGFFAVILAIGTMITASLYLAVGLICICYYRKVRPKLGVD